MRQKIIKKRIVFPQGSVIIFALMVMFILTIATISILTTSATVRRSSLSSGSSAAAFQSAESGMERTLQFIKKNFDGIIADMPICQSGGFIDYNDINSRVRFKDNAGNTLGCGSAISDVKTIQSSGISKQEVRTIEEEVFFGATKLLLHFNGSNDDKVWDSSYYYDNHEEMTLEGGASISSEKKMFEDPLATDDEANSLKLNGSDAYLSIPAIPLLYHYSWWDFFADDFTIDFWINMAAIQPGGSTYIEIGSNELAIYQKDNATLCYLIKDVSTTESCGSFTPSVDTWHHIALVRLTRDSKIKLFVDGTLIQVDAVLDNINIRFLIDNGITIGASQMGDKFFNGYIDELRISQGVARWTGDYTFTPRVAEYWAD